MIILRYHTEHANLKLGVQFPPLNLLTFPQYSNASWGLKDEGGKKIVVIDRATNKKYKKF